MKKLLTFAAVCILVIDVFTQTKIVGYVKDAQTKEPLIGANVIVDNTTYGAATDEKGRYIILNVPPGKYNVSASLIGYAKVTQKGIEVYFDRTTEVNFELKDATIQIEQVTIVAEKPPIIKDRTSTSTSIDAAQISAAPIEGLRGALDLSAAFQRNEKGDYSVRGSGSYEVSFQINGIAQINSNTSAPGTFGTEKADNSWKYDVNPLAIQQMQLISGGFSAEYGNAQAGVVKVALKEGTPKLAGEFRIEYRPAGQYHWGRYVYDKSHYEWQKWGKLENWMTTYRNYVIDQLLLRTRYGYLLARGTAQDSAEYNRIVNEEIMWAYNIWVNNHEPGKNNPFGVYDYRKYSYQRYMIGFGGPLGSDPNLLKFYFSGEYKKNPSRLPTPERNQIAQNYMLNVTYVPIKNHKLKIMGGYQSYMGGIWSGSSDIRWSGLAFTPPGVSTKYLINIDPVREEQTITQSVSYTYTISQNSFLEAIFAYQREKYELPYKYLPGWGMDVDRLDSMKDRSGSVLKSGLWWEGGYFREPYSFSTNYYQDNRSDIYNLNIDYTNQITESNLLKAGIRLGYFELFNNGVNASFQPNSFVARNGFAEYYKAYPYNIAAYVQDKMEYEGMIANIGLRFETYNFQSRKPKDKFRYLYPGTDGPAFFDENGRLIYGYPETELSKAKYILLPRLGLSFPIGESTAFRFQYGHFASMPQFNQALSNKTWSGWQGIANPDLNPKKTINYEFGLQQALDQNHRADLVLYYNDRVDQIGMQKVAAYTGSRNQRAGFGENNQELYYYWTYANNAFGSTIGLEFTFETITYSTWTYRVSYSISQTTEGNYGPEMIFPESGRNYATRRFTGEFLASWDRTHNLRALVQYNLRKDEGIEILGIKPFENSTFSLIYTAQSGLPYTYITDFSLRDARYNRRYPLETNFDFNFSKSIALGANRIILGLRIMNLFDNKHLTPMSTSDDIRNWVEYGFTVKDPGNNPTRLSYVVADYRAFRNIPRQIFFTIGYGFN